MNTWTQNKKKNKLQKCENNWNTNEKEEKYFIIIEENGGKKEGGMEDDWMRIEEWLFFNIC